MSFWFVFIDFGEWIVDFLFFVVVNLWLVIMMIMGWDGGLVIMMIMGWDRNVF